MTHAGWHKVVFECFLRRSLGLICLLSWNPVFVAIFNSQHSTKKSGLPTPQLDLHQLILMSLWKLPALPRAFVESPKEGARTPPLPVHDKLSSDYPHRYTAEIKRQQQHKPGGAGVEVGCKVPCRGSRKSNQAEAPMLHHVLDLPKMLMWAGAQSSI